MAHEQLVERIHQLVDRVGQVFRSDRPEQPGYVGSKVMGRRPKRLRSDPMSPSRHPLFKAALSVASCLFARSRLLRAASSSSTVHDREVRIDNGLVVKISQGLDVMSEARQLVQHWSK